jgi:MFS family permease
MSTPTTAPAAAGRRSRAVPDEAFDRRLLAPLIVGAVLNPVNSSIIAVSLVPIGVAFGAPASHTAWLVSGLYLATAIGQPVVGRLIDAYGPRRLYLAGTTLVGIAGVVGALAPSLGVLVAARVLLGVGTCAGYPAAMHLIRSEAVRTGRDSPGAILTTLAVATQTVAVVGPSLGGLLIGVGGWRATLAVNVPLALAGLALGLRRLPKTTAVPDDPGGGAPPAVDGLDAAGMLLFAAALTALLLVLTDPGTDRWPLLLASVVAAAGFAARELRARVPFIDLRILGGNAPLLATYGRTLLTAVVTYSVIYGYTQWLQAERGLSASEAALVMLPMFVVGIAVSVLTGRRRDVRGKLLVGGAAQLVGGALLLGVGVDTPVWLLLAIATVVGIPQGLNSLANQSALYHQSDATRIGSSAGLLRTCTYLGAITASAAGGVFFGPRTDTAGLHELAAFMVVAAVAFLALTALDRNLGNVGRAPALRDPP